MRVLALGLCSCLLVGGFACQSAQSVPAAVADAGPRSVSVARIVFVDQEQACACSYSRIVKSWAALQAVLGKDSQIPVERIHMDNQAELAKPYLAKKALMVAPGIYLLDETGGLIAQLQGEVSEKQLRKHLPKIAKPERSD